MKLIEYCCDQCGCGFYLIEDAQIISCPECKAAIDPTDSQPVELYLQAEVYLIVNGLAEALNTIQTPFPVAPGVDGQGVREKEEVARQALQAMEVVGSD